MSYKVIAAFRDAKADGIVRPIGSEYDGKDKARITELVDKGFIKEATDSEAAEFAVAAAKATAQKSVVAAAREKAKADKAAAGNNAG